MSNDQKQLLEKQLWAVANTLRGKMNADEYKNYILGFIFYKYLSERLEKYVDEQVLHNDNLKFRDLTANTPQNEEILKVVKNACIDHLGFFLKPTELYNYVYLIGKSALENNNEDEKSSSFILSDLQSIFNSIESTSMGTDSEDDFKGLFDDVDLTSSKLGSTPNKQNKVIVEVLKELSKIDFKLEDSKNDLLGDAYEYLIGEFAAGAGKKGGEFYTPAQVSRLLAKIVTHGKSKIKSVLDPTCGSGSLLLRVKDYADVNHYYGQELNPTTYNLARMNMILHGVHFDNFSIKQGETLTENRFEEIDLKAEAIVANPPFSAEWKSEEDPVLSQDVRFSQYGRLAPKDSADYAFVTHMLYHLAENGTMAIVLPHGVLFRPDAEYIIRKYIIQKLNFLDAVIGLPANLFYGTPIPATILIFKKCRRDKDDILFIDASREFEKQKKKNYLTDKNVEKIFETYIERNNIDKYSRKVTLDEIRGNDFNLNILRYIDNFEEESIINVQKVASKLKELQKEEEYSKAELEKFCKELGINTPF